MRMFLFFVTVFATALLPLLSGAESKNPADEPAIPIAPVIVRAGDIDLGLSFSSAGKLRFVVIMRVLERSRAFRAGVKPGMLLVSIQGKDLAGMTRDQFDEHITTPFVGDHVYHVRKIVPSHSSDRVFLVGGRWFGDVEKIVFPSRAPDRSLAKTP
jgi:hypothetical protein